MRDEVLRSHPWNFAVARKEIAALSSTPVYEYENEFQLPSDIIRILDFEDSDGYKYKIEGKKILSNASIMKIKYIKKVEDESEFDSSFAEVLAFRLAAELAYPLVQSVNLSQNMYRLYENALLNAKTFDGQEGTPPELINDLWLKSRL
jgi:hypothetical protein